MSKSKHRAKMKKRQKRREEMLAEETEMRRQRFLDKQLQCDWTFLYGLNKNGIYGGKR